MPVHDFTSNSLDPLVPLGPQSKVDILDQSVIHRLCVFTARVTLT